MSDRRLGMRMLDAGRNQRVTLLQLYLTAEEAAYVRDGLTALLVDPEKLTHFHLSSESSDDDFSCSLITPKKLASGGYTDDERRLFGE